MYAEEWKNEAYRRLKTIRQRCERVRCPAYKWYGALGVQCRLDVHEFLDWYRSTKPVNGAWTIGRKNHSGHYTIDNIEWQSQSYQSRERNIRRGLPKCKGHSIVVLVHGVEHFFRQQKDAAKFLGVSRSQITNALADNAVRAYTVRRL